MKWVRWVFWLSVYLFRPRPRELVSYLLRGKRLRPPWWKFRSSAWHNDPGSMWEVCLSDESSYTVSKRTLTVDLHIGQESGKVTGFNVRDECLHEADEAKGGDHGHQD